MINGKCAFVQVDYDRYANFTRTLYDSEWNRIDAEWKRKRGKAIPRPPQLEKMLALAEKLSASLDYIRIDFYVQDERVFLGEMTNYPARGRGKFTPQSFDFELGKRWKLNTSMQKGLALIFIFLADLQVKIEGMYEWSI